MGWLRGGLAMAMALSLPREQMLIAGQNLDIKALFLMMTYTIVMFSILVQGSTITPMMKKRKNSITLLEDAHRYDTQHNWI